MASSYWTTYSWTTSTTSTTSNTYWVDYNDIYKTWKTVINPKKDKLDECKIKDDELLDLIRDDV